MKKYWILGLVILAACQQPSGTKEKAEEVDNPLLGNWYFMDKYGNYNEAWFADSVYQTINKLLPRKIVVRYTVSNDSLHSATEFRGEKRTIHAGLEWLDRDHLVITTRSVSDTLWRLKDAEITLQNTDPERDSLTFYTAFYKRYEDFLISRGILTEKEVRDFHEKREIPEDIRKKVQGN